MAGNALTQFTADPEIIAEVVLREAADFEAETDFGQDAANIARPALALKSQRWPDLETLRPAARVTPKLSSTASNANS